MDAGNLSACFSIKNQKTERSYVIQNSIYFPGLCEEPGELRTDDGHLSEGRVHHPGGAGGGRRGGGEYLRLFDLRL